MSAPEVQRTIEIAGSPDACLAAIADYESYPRWQPAIREARVLERDAKGRAVVVEFVCDVLVATIRYVLKYAYDARRHSLKWEYVEGDVRDIHGSYVFAAAGPGKTSATYTVSVDPGRFVPGWLAGSLTGAALTASMEALKRRVESKAEGVSETSAARKPRKRKT